MQKVIIHTDGSCLGNPGPGGWAAILALDGTDHRRELAGGFRRTTNNRMELTAVVEALSALKTPCRTEVYTDSQYVRNAVEKKWLFAWRSRGWRKADKKPVPNSDLWRLLLPLLQRHDVRFFWLRGHAGDSENERCDRLARSFAQNDDLPADIGYEQPEKVCEEQQP